MSLLHEIEIYLNTDFGADQLCVGKCNPTKNQYYYRVGQYYVVRLNRNKYMICSDTNITRKLLGEHVFHCNGNYAVTSRKGGRGVVSFHRMYLSPPLHLVSDHINRYRSDNRSENLRVVTYSENNRNKSIAGNNTSGKQGVSICTMNEKKYWRASIVDLNRKLIFRSFSITRYGNGPAFEMACDQRRLWEQEHGYIGV